MSSLEDFSTQLSQELVDHLVDIGEIEPKTNQQFQNDLNVRECKKNDRYDELISAFNVILQEVLKQEDKSDYRIENDSREMPYIFTDTRLKQTHSPKTKRNQRQKCLNPKEEELLQNIKMLNNQLNFLIENSANEASKRKRSAHGIRSHIRHSDNRSSVLPANHIDGEKIPQNIAPTTQRNHMQDVSQTSVFEESISEKMVTNRKSPVNNEYAAVSSVQKQ